MVINKKADKLFQFKDFIDNLNDIACLSSLKLKAYLHIKP